MRLLFVFYCFVLSSSFVQAQTNADDSSIVSLASIVGSLLITHPEIQATESGIQEATGLLRQAGLRPNPEIQASYGTPSILGESGDQEWSVAYVQTFELGKKRGRRLTVAEIGLLMAKQQLQDRKRNLILEVNKTYADVLSNQELVKATSRSVDAHRKLHEFTVEKVNLGEAASVEKDLSEIELSRLELELATLLAQLSATISKLKMMAGLHEGQSVGGSFLEDIPVQNIDLNTIRRIVKEKNPQLLISRLESQQAEAAVSLAKAEGVPDIDVFLEYSNEKSQFDAFGIGANNALVPLKDSDQIVSTGITFELPFSKNEGNMSAAVARLEQVRLRTKLLEKTIEHEVELAFRKYEVARQTYGLYKDSIIKQSEKQMEIMRISFESGELRFLDWINEQKRTLEIQRAFIAAAKDFFLASAELEFLAGSGLKQTEDL